MGCWMKLLGPCKEEDDEVEAERRDGLQLAGVQAATVDTDLCWICPKRFVFAGDAVYDRGNFNVSTCVSFALYSDNLQLPLAAPTTGRPLMHFFFPLFFLLSFQCFLLSTLGWGWFGGWVGATTSWHLHTCLMLRHEKSYSSTRYVINIYIYIITDGISSIKRGARAPFL